MANVSGLSPSQLRFIHAARVAHLATASLNSQPHVIPICFVFDGKHFYSPIDEKPKRGPAIRLKRLRNISENPMVAVVVDRYEEDWGRLGWVMLYGHADILAHGIEHDQAQALLGERYPQLATMQIAEHPVIAVRIARVSSWGNLSVAPPTPF